MKILVLKSGCDGDLGCEHLILLKDRAAVDRARADYVEWNNKWFYSARGIERATGRISFQDWLIKHGVCRVADDSEIEIYDLEYEF